MLVRPNYPALLMRCCDCARVVLPAKCLLFTGAFGPVAQWLEPTAHNGLVGGSSPPGPTTQSCRSENFPKMYECPRIGGPCRSDFVSVRLLRRSSAVFHRSVSAGQNTVSRMDFWCLLGNGFESYVPGSSKNSFDMIVCLLRSSSLASSTTHFTAREISQKGANRPELAGFVCLKLVSSHL